MIEKILETQQIDKLAAHYHAAPHKMAQIHEADAEIVDMGGDSPNYLAITTDALVEEVSSGLYADPYFIGWMLAMVNFSDLAAVGADPLGLLVSITSSRGNDKFLAKLSKGVSDACLKLNSFVLGGDTNQAEELFLSGCAVGLVPKEFLLTRKGAKVHDRLYLTYPAGLGNVFAYLKFWKMGSLLPTFFYKPTARIKEGRIIREFASCCMDTSDGVLHTVDTLMRLNRCQFVLFDDWMRILHPLAAKICRLKQIIPWLVLAGIHGEFELVFAVSPENEADFQSAAHRIKWTPLLIGEICEGEGVCIRKSDELYPLDTGAIRNLGQSAGADPIEYILQLSQMAQDSGIG